MGLSNTLIMDPDPHSCSIDHGGQIAKLLPKLLPDSEVVIQTGTHVQPVNTTSLFSYLILLKSSLKGKLHDAIQALKCNWMAAPVTGIFCSNKAASSPAQGLVAEAQGGTLLQKISKRLDKVLDKR